MLLILLACFTFAAGDSEMTEPQCLSSFDYHHKLLYKLIKIEEKVEHFESFFEELKKDRTKEENQHKEALSKTLERFKNMSETELELFGESSNAVMSKFDTSAKTWFGNMEKLSKLPAVGFTVHTPKAGPTSGQISFISVTTNEGDGFDTATGVFTCKIPGYYYFSVSLLKTHGYNGYVHCQIYKNKTRLAYVHAEPGHSTKKGYYGATNSVYVHLAEGDTVWLGSCSVVSSFYPNSHTSFTGFLIRPDMA